MLFRFSIFLLFFGKYMCCVLSCLGMSNSATPRWGPPGSSVHGILQATILEWVAMPFSRGSSQPRERTQVSHIAGEFFTIWITREAQEYWSGWVSGWSHSVVSDSLWPMDCSLPGLSLHGISQSRILEWVAYPFSRRTFRPRNRTRVSCIASRLFTSWAIREAHMKCKNVNSTENYKEYK